MKKPPKKILSLLILGLIYGGSIYAEELQKAILAAELRDPNLAAALSNRDGAQENIAIARSKLLPQINAQGSYSRAQQDITQTSPSGQSNNRQQNVNALNSTVSLRQGIIRPRDWVGLSIGELQAQLGSQKLVAAQSDLWSRVLFSWLDVVTAHETVKTYAQSVESTRLAAEQARRRLTAGDGTRDALSEAEAQNALAIAQLYESQQSLRSRQIAYRLIVGQDLDVGNNHLPRYKNLKIPTTLEQLTQDVKDKNGELLSLKITEEINYKRILQAKSDHYPTLDLVSAYTKAESDTITTIGTRYTTRSIGAQLTIPIFSGGGLNAQERQSIAFHKASTYEKQALDLKLTATIEKDWSIYLSGFERVTAAEQSVEAAEQQLKAAQMGLRSGIKTWGDVAQVTMLMTRRKVDFINITADSVRAQIRLLSYLPPTEDIWSLWIRTLSSAAKK